MQTLKMPNQHAEATSNQGCCIMLLPAQRSRMKAVKAIQDVKGLHQTRCAQALWCLFLRRDETAVPCGGLLCLKSPRLVSARHLIGRSYSTCTILVRQTFYTIPNRVLIQ